MGESGTDKSQKPKVFFREETSKKSEFVSKKDMTVEIESQLKKKIIQIVIWVVIAIVFTIFGGIITSLWEINGEVKELKGKYASPNLIIENTSKRIEILEEKNYSLLDSLHKLEQQKMQAEIDTLKAQLNKTK